MQLHKMGSRKHGRTYASLKRNLIYSLPPDWSSALGKCPIAISFEWNISPERAGKLKKLRTLLGLIGPSLKLNKQGIDHLHWSYQPSARKLQGCSFHEVGLSMMGSLESPSLPFEIS